jgi:hypothetical protein
MKSKFGLRFSLSIFAAAAVLAFALCFLPGKVWASDHYGLGYTAPSGYSHHQDAGREKIWLFSDNTYIALSYTPASELAYTPGDHSDSGMNNLTGSYSGLGNLPVWGMITTAQGITMYNVIIGASDREFLVQSAANANRTETFMATLRKNNLNAPNQK